LVFRDHQVLLVFPAMLVLPAILVFPEPLALLVFLDVKVQKVIVVNQVFQVVPELVLVVQKVKKESPDHLLPIHLNLRKKSQAIPVTCQYQFLVPPVRRALWEVKVNLVKLVILVLPVLLDHQV
jgi:hypothetical protein